MLSLCASHVGLVTTSARSSCDLHVDLQSSWAWLLYCTCDGPRPIGHTARAAIEVLGQPPWHAGWACFATVWLLAYCLLPLCSQGHWQMQPAAGLLDAQSQADHAACIASPAMQACHDMQMRPSGPYCGLAVQSPKQHTACKINLGQVQVPQSIHAPMCTTTPSSPAKARKLAAGPWQKLPGPRQHPHTYLLSNARWSHTPPSQLPRVCPMPTAPCAAEAAHGSSSHLLGLRAPHLLPSSLRHPSCPPRLPCGTPPAQRVPPGGHEPPEQARTLGGHQTLS